MTSENTALAWSLLTRPACLIYPEPRLEPTLIHQSYGCSSIATRSGRPMRVFFLTIGQAGGELVEPSGIEPPTSALRTRRSPN